MQQEGNLVAKLPDFLFKIKSDNNHNNQSQHCFSRLLIRRYLCMAVISIMLSFTANVQASENDSDGDGLTDTYEVKIGTESYLSDTDGDGISDATEVGKNLKKPLDTDNDGVIDALDYDDDNDGLPTYLESKIDSDKDNSLGYLDKDSDNDGVLDGEEAGYLNQDKNLDGIDDAFDLARTGSVDANGDGIDDNVKLPDHDNRGKPDYLDATYQHKSAQKILIKNDVEKVKISVDTKTKKPEEVKADTKTFATKEEIKKLTEVAKSEKTVEPKIDNMIINRHTDSDNDGLSNSLEKILGTNPLSRDTDGDKVSDAIEIGLDVNSPQDSDRDGIIDALDDDDDNDGILTKLEDLNGDSTAINEDTDNDGVPNYLDANDDGDNLLTKAEGSVLDSDGDSILDYLDKNDGMKDQSNASNTKAVVKGADTSNEPEIVVLFDGDAAALAAGDPTLDEESIQDDILSSIENLSLDQNESENAEPDESIQQTKLNAHTTSPHPW